MEKRSEKIFFVILSLLFVIGIFFDRNIANFFNSNQNNYIYILMNFISLYAFLIPLFIVTYILLTFVKKKNIIKFPVSLILTLSFVYILKSIIQRERPFSSEFNSFPSNHSASVFSILPFFNIRYRVIWFVFSSLVAFSRIYLGRHFLTDVIAGIFIGYVIGIFTDKFVEKRI